MHAVETVIVVDDVVFLPSFSRYGRRGCGGLIRVRTNFDAELHASIDDV